MEKIKKQRANSTSVNPIQSENYELPPAIFQKIDQLLNSIQKEGGSQIMAAAIHQPEPNPLFQKEDWVCLINFETDTNGITLNNGMVFFVN